MSDSQPDPRFSTILPSLQIRVNSSSLGPFKQCPRKYQYSIIEQIEPLERSVDLTFGTLVHEGLARYESSRIGGINHDQAVLDVIDWVLRATWNAKLKRPWVSGHPQKNRLTLIRTLVWYLDYWLSAQDSYKTIQLANGQPAVELDFAFDSGYTTQSTSEPVVFIGRLDQIVKFAGDVYVKDTKTTKHGLDRNYVSWFTPDNQLTLYSIAGRVAFGQPARGLILDAIQVTADETRFHREAVPRDPAGLDEWLGESHYWLRQMEQCAQANYWPMNDKGCGLYGGCEFKGVCGAPPSQRQSLLRQGFRRRVPTGQEDFL